MTQARLFTTLRVAEGEILFWPDHVARLRVGGALDEEALRTRIAAAVRGMADARVRITLRPPEPPRIEAREYAPPSEPWRLRPVTVSPAGDAPLPKTTDRARYDEARAGAGDADDALLLGPRGEVLETTVANVFFRLPGGGLVTPRDGGILPGIVRARLLGRARETALGLAEAAHATACVVTNAVLLVHPVASIEGVAEYDSPGLARDLREEVARMAPGIRIIRR
ncbi:MAG TPA: aminotransferase class IV [Planctomycetota bacterium]|nr:aminotransferase class IV [Planctomycetota bacterium]